MDDFWQGESNDGLSRVIETSGGFKNKGLAFTGVEASPSVEQDGSGTPSCGNFLRSVSAGLCTDANAGFHNLLKV